MRSLLLGGILLVCGVLLGVLVGTSGWLGSGSIASAAPAVTATASVSASSVAAGQSVTITAQVTSTTAIPALVDIEVYNAGGNKVYQRFWDNQSLPAGSTQSFQTPWTVDATTASGAYTVKVGVMQPSWGPLYTWNNDAARIQVVPPGGSAASPTSTASATATPVPGATGGCAPATSTAVATMTPSATPTPTPTVLPTPLPTVTPTSAPPVPPSGNHKLFGVNVAGAEFGDPSGALGTGYTYAADASRQSYFAGKGLTLIRMPFMWEHLQPTAQGALSPADVAGLRAMLDAAQAAHQQVILDLHNYGRYHGTALTTADAPKLADVWTRLAQEFNGHPALYGYELMNEPHDLVGDGGTWQGLAQAATDAIRKVDTTHYVLIPGYSWQSARFWRDNNEGLTIADPTGKLLYAAHIYFDANYTGTYGNSYDADGTTPTIGVDRIQPFLAWLADHRVQGIFTEYGVPNNDPRWNTVLDNFLGALNTTPNVVGGTYWAAGPWWGSYPLSVEPLQNPDGSFIDRPQMAVLSQYPSH